MKISLIISVYKNIDFLDLVLKSVSYQTYKDFEVIIAEDNDGEEMRMFLDKSRNEYNYILKHVGQKDSGFRKTRILNKAIKISDGEILVFIDGDCILHKDFLKQYSRNYSENTCMFGRRVMLSQKISEKLLSDKDLKILNLFSLVISGSSKIEEGFYLPFFKSLRKSGLKGCNMGIPKKLMIKINGFDEDYEKPWGGEDTDLERRLQLAGADFRCTKFKTIQYHLYHKLIPRGDYDAMVEYNKEKIKENEFFCKKGLNK